MAIGYYEGKAIYLDIGDFVLGVPAGKETSGMLCNGEFKEAYKEIKRLSDALREKQGKDKEV